MSKTKSGMMLRQGEIVLVPFPFSDLSTTKRRPALVISRGGYNEGEEDIVICAVTSNLENKSYSVLVRDIDLTSGKLLAVSRIKADKLFTIKKSKVIKKLALVSDPTLNKVKDEMIKLFAF